MTTSSLFFRTFLTFTVLASLGSPALAQPSCPDGPGDPRCDAQVLRRPGSAMDAPSFAVSQSSPAALNSALSTGRIPMGSPITFEFGVRLTGATRVELMGGSLVTWPEPLTAELQGNPGGRVHVMYDVEPRVGAGLDIPSLGFSFDFNALTLIPDFPQFGVDQEITLNNFVLPGDGGPVMLEALTMSDTYSITLQELVRLFGSDADLPAVIRDIELGITIRMRLNVEYETQDLTVTDVMGPGMTVVTADSTPFMLGPITPPDFGRERQLVVTPHGVIRYLPQIDIVPSLDINVAGFSFNILSAISGAFPDGNISSTVRWVNDGYFQIDLASRPIESPVTFPAVTVTVPLPNYRGLTDEDDQPIATELDFGTVMAGQTVTRTITIANNGRAPLVVELSNTNSDLFMLGSSMVDVSAGSSTRDSTKDVTITWVPTLDPGQTEDTEISEVTLITNDPDMPMITIELVGTVLAPPMPDAGPGVDAAVVVPDGGLPDDAGLADDGGIVIGDGGVADAGVGDGGRRPTGAATGSCSCRTTGGAPSGGAAIVTMALLGLVVARRRRRAR